MKRFPFSSLLALILAITACSTPPAITEPTATLLLTDTPVPTSTPLPTDTPTPLPTATQDVAATKAAQATQSAADVLSELDDLLGDDSDIPYQDGQLLWQQTKPLKIQLSGPDNKILAVDKDLTAKDFIFKSDVTWEASGILICGAAFRSEPDIEEGKQYQFLYLRLSGLPAWIIEVHEFGRFKNTPTKTKYSDALDLDNGSTNQFVLAAQDDHFTIYINNVRLGTYYDYSKQRTEGAFGVVGYQDSGNGTCEFENSWVWSLE